MATTSLQAGALPPGSQVASRSVAPGAASDGAHSPSRTVNQKRLPCPASLSTPISPPISSTSRLLMLRPSPVPPYLRVVEASACWKASKMPPTCSGVRPMPVSRTTTLSSTACAKFCASATCTCTLPRAVNLMALPIRLLSTWPRRSGSPSSSSGTCGSICQSSCSCFSAARFSNSVTLLRSTSSRRSGTVSTRR